jgi:nickel superoxide dismutase
MNGQLKRILAASLILAGAAAIAFAHCQIPCGIYGDDTRFTLMREHIATIEKSMKEIDRIGNEGRRDNNQLVRWVMNKETHAAELAEIVTFYFMAQRVKPVSADKQADHAKYVEQITLLHQTLVLSMKAKQTTDVELCASLRSLVDQFEKSYTGK